MSQWDDHRKPTLLERIQMDLQHDHMNSNIKYWAIMIGSLSLSALILWYAKS